MIRCRISQFRIAFVVLLPVSMWIAYRTQQRKILGDTWYRSNTHWLLVLNVCQIWIASCAQGGPVVVFLGVGDRTTNRFWWGEPREDIHIRISFILPVILRWCFIPGIISAIAVER